LLSYAAIRPGVLQVELHPLHTQEKLLRFCRENGIAVTGFSPLAAESYLAIGMAQPQESVLKEEPIIEAAQRHGKTRAQVVRENLDLFDFELAADEMQAIGSLNRGRRFNDPGEFCERAFGTFFPIYE
jgi:D-xylose reductase